MQEKPRDHQPINFVLEQNFQRCSELVRLLVFAANGNASSRSRTPMELLAMWALPGRLVYATHRLTYTAFSRKARENQLAMQGNDLWLELLVARRQIERVFSENRIIPRTRQGALLDCILDQIIFTREMVAAAANVSTDTAGRWMNRLMGLGLVVKIQAGNIDVHFSRHVTMAVLREFQRHLGRATDDESVNVVLRTPVKIPMDDYQGAWDGVARRLRHPAQTSPYLSHLPAKYGDKLP